MAVVAKEFLVKLFNDEISLLLIVRKNDLNSAANGESPLCISDCGPKLEVAIGHPVGHAFLAEKCKRLVAHGFLIPEPGKGGRKNLRLSPVVGKIFDCFDEMDGGLK